MLLLVTGASGHLGRRAAEWLAERGAKLRLASRTPAKAPQFPDVEVVRSDFAQPETLAAAFRGVDAALVISGSAAPGERALQHRNAFEAAAAAQVGHVVYLSLQGTGPQSRFSYSRDHDASERFLAGSGLAGFTILRNAFYLDMLPILFDRDGVLRGPGGDGRAAFISREDAARCAAAAILRRPGGIHEVTGPEAITLGEATARLAHLTHLPLRYEPRAAAGADQRPGAEDWRADLYTGWFQAIAAGELARTSPTVELFTDEDPLTLEGYFSAFPEALSPLYERMPAADRR